MIRQSSYLSPLKGSLFTLVLFSVFMRSNYLRYFCGYFIEKFLIESGSRTGQGNDLASTAADQAVTQSPSSGHPHSLNLR